MRSLRTKITLMTVCVILLALTIITLFSTVFIRKNEHRKTEQLLLLLCETGEKNIDYYFNSVQKSVRQVASYAETDLNMLKEDQLEQHIERVRACFDGIASKTNGVLTYYYRIDPEITQTVKGFWYTDLNGTGFEEHEVTDITLYDTSDTSSLVWFTVPKYKGEPVWLSPYITDNLNKRVISYNVPVNWRGRFFGVIGIEVDYTTLAEQVDSIRLYGNGYAYLSDAEGNLFYHPRIDVSSLTEETKPAIPDGAVGESTFLSYTFKGVKKLAAWLPLNNGMRLNVAVPVSEVEGEWYSLLRNIIIGAVAALLATGLFIMFYTRRITKPLEQLTEAAEQAENGNYDYKLDYKGNDEVGRLTNTFKQMSGHMKDHISDLNRQVYVDALTHVKNKGAFATAVDDLQSKMDQEMGQIEFGIGMFDCDDLKAINDKYGHDKGDTYLKAACTVICRVFQHSPVFRIGGDEFAVILKNADYQAREALVKLFEQVVGDINATTANQWEQVHVSIGIAVYDARNDRSVNDVLHRANEIMYENKRVKKPAK
ncbi:MAG: diguanylate cyclase [Clostridia bacterium]|nr:diguanylate cyclase [Clostridia bacterium]MBR6186077.1 diguanylate cyclase [Clostridia bacterium]